MKVTPFVDITIVIPSKHSEHSTYAVTVLARKENVELIAPASIKLNKHQALQISEALREAAECLKEEEPTHLTEKARQEVFGESKLIDETITQSENPQK